LGSVISDTASKVFRLIRNEFEFCGQLKSNRAGQVVSGGKLVLTNPDTTIEFDADERGQFSRVMKKYLQPDQNAYTVYIYSDNHFFFIENIEFQLPRTYRQYREFVVPNLENGAKVILYNVFYEQYRYFLTQRTFPELLRSVDYLKAHPNLVIEIGGHTSSPGSSSYNLWLSERRAEAVRDFYVGLGIPESSLRIKGYGEDFPIATNLTRDGQAQNRRIELKVMDVRNYFSDK
jgi:outer membrane protein OmpA-like peptidoglycan-associated protein